MQTEPAQEVRVLAQIEAVGELRPVGVAIEWLLVGLGAIQLDEGPQEIRVGPAVEQALVNVNRDGGGKPLPGRQGAEEVARPAIGVFAETAQLQVEGLAGSLEQRLVQNDRQRLRLVLEPVHRGDVDRRPVVDRLVGENGIFWNRGCVAR